MFYLLQYFSFLTAPHPEIGREMVDGLAEGFISRSPVLLRNTAGIAHAPLSRKWLLHQFQGDKQNSISGEFAAQMVRIQRARGSAAPSTPEGPPGASEVIDWENVTLHHFHYKRTGSLSPRLVSYDGPAGFNAGKRQHFKDMRHKAYWAIHTSQVCKCHFFLVGILGSLTSTGVFSQPLSD